MNESCCPENLALGKRFSESVLSPIKEIFVGKDEVIDLMGVTLVARENLFILGPPGTAKSALVRELSNRIEGRVFDYLLTRFSEPNEIFGPFDIRKLRDGELETNTEGMLPEADFVFLDELLNANSAILNSLLLVLNERLFRRGRETRKLPTLMVIGASNRLPDDDAIGALFDRFLLRVPCDNVQQENLSNVLVAGWRLEENNQEPKSKITVEDVRTMQGLLHQVDLQPVLKDYVDLVYRLRHIGIAISDRRAVKLQRMLAASAVLCGRLHANRTDMWVLRYIWDTQEQQDLLDSIVGDIVETASDEEKIDSHPRVHGQQSPNPESLAHDLECISTKLGDPTTPIQDRACLQDQLGVLASRCQWVQDAQQRDFLENQVNALLAKLEE